MFSMFTNALAIASYVLLGLGMYSIARRRGINKPWLAWIPVANVWLLGCISDQYRQVAHGQVTHRRKTLLTLQITVLSLAMVVAIIAGVWLAGLMIKSDVTDEMMETMIEVSTTSDMGKLEDLTEQFMDVNEAGVEEYVDSTMWLLLVMLGLTVVLLGLAIWAMVVQFKAYFDIFASSDPQNAKMYFLLGLILSLLGFAVALSLFVFLCRYKDLGMPPRSGERPEPEPVALPPETE